MPRFFFICKPLHNVTELKIVKHESPFKVLLSTLIVKIDLQDSRGVAPPGGVDNMVAAHQVRYPGEPEDQLLLPPVLLLEDVGVVGQAGGAVGGVEAPVLVL